jgi:hypothetical protein
MEIYQVVFCQDGYTCVDYETSIYEQAQEVMAELRSQMYLAGERNFDYIIKELKVRKGE